MSQGISRAFLVCLSLALSFPAYGSDRGDPVVLYLVRHAEKASVAGDPPLTQEGWKRANLIARGLANRGIESVWSSDYRRTSDTAAPLAKELGVETGIYDPRSQEQFAQELVGAGVNALVVGHSNTIPELAEILCKCEVATMDDTEYGRLMVITVDDSGISLSVFRQHEYFQASGQP